MQVSIKSNLDALAKHVKSVSPRQIKIATQRSINHAATKSAVKGRAELVREVDPVLVGRVTKLVKVRKATNRGVINTSAYIDFLERGMGVENIKSTKIVRVRAKKGRGASGRWNVTLRGQGTIKAFKLGADKGKRAPTFIRSKGKLKRLFSHTAVQALLHEKIDEKLANQVPGLAVPEFIRQVDIFKGARQSDRRRR